MIYPKANQNHYGGFQILFKKNKIVFYFETIYLPTIQMEESNYLLKKYKSEPEMKNSSQQNKRLNVKNKLLKLEKRWRTKQQRNKKQGSIRRYIF